MVAPRGACATDGGPFRSRPEAHCIRYWYRQINKNRPYVLLAARCTPPRTPQRAAACAHAAATASPMIIMPCTAPLPTARTSIRPGGKRSLVTFISSLFLPPSFHSLLYLSVSASLPLSAILPIARARGGLSSLSPLSSVACHLSSHLFSTPVASSRRVSFAYSPSSGLIWPCLPLAALSPLFFLVF